MASRPRRGKQMSLMIPPTPQPREETDSDDDNDEEEEEDDEVEEDVEMREGGGEEQEEDEETSSSESEADSHKSANGKYEAAMNIQQKQQQLRQEQQGNDDEDDDEVMEDDDEEEEEEESEQDGGEDDVSDEQERDEEDFRPPPTPRVTLPSDKLREMERQRTVTPINIREPQEVSKIYTELIDVCHNLESDIGFDGNFQDVMSSNIKRGHALFEHLMKGNMGPSTSDDSSGAKRIIGGPGDMYLAFLHTQISSNIIRTRAERIGSGASIFSVESYLDNLKREFVDDDGYYNPKLAAANIAMQTAVGTKTLMPLVAVVGTFDRDAVIVPKAKKPRVSIRRANVEEQQDNVADDNADNMQLVQQNIGAENLAKEMNKILKHTYRQNPEPVNLYEFVLDRSSFPKTVENIFYLSFLVKDGHVSLSKEENGKFKDLSLNIKPEKSQKLQTSSPDEGETSRNQTHRQKHILSFSPRMWKQMVAMSEGQDVISFYQQMMEAQQNQQANPPLQAIKYN